MKKGSSNKSAYMYVDPSKEVAEPHLLYEENTFPASSTIPKDHDPKRVDALIEAIHEDFLQKEIDRQQKASFRSSEQQGETRVTIIDEPKLRTAGSHEHVEKPVDTPSRRSLRSSHVNFQLPAANAVENETFLENSTSEEPADMSNETMPLAGVSDLEQLLAEEEFIPGGFTNLDERLEAELLNDYFDDFDHLSKERQRKKSSMRSSEPRISVIRSPVELWQRARLLIAIHLYQAQMRSFFAKKSSSTTLMDDAARLLDMRQDMDASEQLVDHPGTAQDRQIICGLQILQQIHLTSSQELVSVDHYEGEQGYLLMYNVKDTHEKNRLTDDQNYANKFRSRYDAKMVALSDPNHQLVASTLSKNGLKTLSKPYRLILAVTNTSKHGTWLLLFGDASRRSIFLSKQELPSTIHSLLYLPHTSMLFLGCQGRVLLYNTQPLQYTSPPLFTSELSGLPFSPLETIIDICHVDTERAVGLLSSRCFVLWQYSNNEHIRLKFCNPYQYGFNRCYFISRFQLLIFTYEDGALQMYQLQSMKPIRWYYCHWNPITSLITSHDQKYLLTSSTDRRINIWNLETLQHLYRYQSSTGIDQLKIIHENLFYYHTKHHIVFFKIHLPTILFALIGQSIKSMVWTSDGQHTARLIVLLENNSCLLLSPVSGSRLAAVPNVSHQPIKEILHDLTRSHFYTLQYNGEILLYSTESTPCIAEYKIQTKSKRYTITCMTSINPSRTNLFGLKNLTPSIEASLEKSLIFFGHADGYLSLYQGGLLKMEPIQAHPTTIVCLVTSQTSMERSNISLTHCEILLSANDANQIRLWDLILHIEDESIELIPLINVEQEKNISLQSIHSLLMINNFIFAHYSDQSFLHLWQLVNISISSMNKPRYGIVEHPTKGSHHRSGIKAIAGTSKFKLFASSDDEGCVKFWDNTNTLYREILFDRSLTNIEFLPNSGEFLIAYQHNLHLMLPDQYLTKNRSQKDKENLVRHWIAEENRLEVIPPVVIPYQSLPIFIYSIKSHHQKRRLDQFERQLAGRFAVKESDSSPSDEDTSPARKTDQLSLSLDDPSWSGLTEEVKDILRMKRQQHQRTETYQQ